jgi:hypothetical protein
VRTWEIHGIGPHLIVERVQPRHLPDGTRYLGDIGGRFSLSGRVVHDRQVSPARLVAQARAQRERLRELGFVGSIDQFVDSTDVLSYPRAEAQVTASLWE